jgi:hypothetical protein
MKRMVHIVDASIMWHPPSGRTRSERFFSCQRRPPRALSCEVYVYEVVRTRCIRCPLRCNIIPLHYVYITYPMTEAPAVPS